MAEILENNTVENPENKAINPKENKDFLKKAIFYLKDGKLDENEREFLNKYIKEYNDIVGDSKSQVAEIRDENDLRERKIKPSEDYNTLRDNFAKLGREKIKVIQKIIGTEGDGDFGVGTYIAFENSILSEKFSFDDLKYLGYAGPNIEESLKTIDGLSVENKDKIRIMLLNSSEKILFTIKDNIISFYDSETLEGPHNVNMDNMPTFDETLFEMMEMDNYKELSQLLKNPTIGKKIGDFIKNTDEYKEMLELGGKDLNKNSIKLVQSLLGIEQDGKMSPSLYMAFMDSGLSYIGMQMGDFNNFRKIDGNLNNLLKSYPKLSKIDKEKLEVVSSDFNKGDVINFNNGMLIVYENGDINTPNFIDLSKIKSYSEQVEEAISGADYKKLSSLFDLKPTNKDLKNQIQGLDDFKNLQKQFKDLKLTSADVAFLQYKLGLKPVGAKMDRQGKTAVLEPQLFLMYMNSDLAEIDLKALLENAPNKEEKEEDENDITIPLDLDGIRCLPGARNQCSKNAANNLARLGISAERNHARVLYEREAQEEGFVTKKGLLNMLEASGGNTVDLVMRKENVSARGYSGRHRAVFLKGVDGWVVLDRSYGNGVHKLDDRMNKIKYTRFALLNSYNVSNTELASLKPRRGRTSYV